MLGAYRPPRAYLLIPPVSPRSSLTLLIFRAKLALKKPALRRVLARE